MTSGLRANGPVWGNLLNKNPGLGGTNLNAAATWIAFSYLATSDRTLNKVRVYLNKTGSPAASDYVLEIYYGLRWRCADGNSRRHANRLSALSNLSGP